MNTKEQDRQKPAEKPVDWEALRRKLDKIAEESDGRCKREN